MTDTEHAPVKRTSRLRPPAPDAVQADTQVAAPEPEPEPSSVPLVTPAVPASPTPLPEPIKKHDVVQVIDTTSRHYGGFFVVGDVIRDQVHGYLVSEGRKKEYVTVRLRDCWYIGTAKIRSQTPCSPKWLSDWGNRRV